MVGEVEIQFRVLEFNGLLYQIRYIHFFPDWSCRSKTLEKPSLLRKIYNSDLRDGTSKVRVHEQYEGL